MESFGDNLKGLRHRIVVLEREVEERRKEESEKIREVRRLLRARFPL